MTSKNLRKDSTGVWQLTAQDIKNIEGGMTNYLFESKGLYPRLYQSVWEFDQYLKNGAVNAHSLSQRIYYLKTAFSIIHDNFWFGVGTGDAQIEFNKKYAQNDAPLSDMWKLRSHNQFVAFFVTFGLLGFVIIIASFIYLPFTEKRWRNFYFVMFYMVALLSFLNEDTLETQAGATFFAFFVAFFIYAQPKGDN
jgi:O-antigen ligase